MSDDVLHALIDRVKINGVWTVLGSMRFRSTTVKPDGTVRLGYTGAGFPGYPAFRFDEAKNAWYAVVPAAECDVIVEISHQASYHGHLCTVNEADHDGVGLQLVGGDDPEARALGFDMVERWVYQKFVSHTDVDHHVVVHGDLLFPYWQQSTFGFSLHAGNWQQHISGPCASSVGYDRFRAGGLIVGDGTGRAPDDPAADAGGLYDVSTRASHRGEEFQVVTISPGGMAALRRASGEDAEHFAHVSTLYNYREILRDVLFDRWLAEHTSDT